MKITILTLFLSILAALPMKMFVFYEEENKEDIELEGNTEDDNKKSLVIPFRAYQVNNAEIRVMSYDAFTEVTLCIVDSMGRTMDAQTLSLDTIQTVSFDINGYATGMYTLIITSPQGIYLTGVFEVAL